MNYETKEWKVLTHKDKAHDGIITSLCELSNKRIISASYDTTIKVWSVLSNNDIQPKDIRKAEKAYKFYKKFVNEIKDLQTSRRMIKNTINKAKLKLKNETGQKRKTDAQKRKKRNN